MKTAAFLLLFITAFQGLYASGWRDSTTIDKRDHMLGEVVVTADAPKVEVIPAQELNGEELQRLNSNSIADALRYFSGVQVKDYGGVGGIKIGRAHV